MRILLLADPILTVPPRLYGGIERIVAELVIAFRLRGHEVHLIALRGSEVSAEQLHFWPAEDVSGRWATWRNLRFVRHICRQISPDVVHSFARLAYLTGILNRPGPKIMSYQRVPGLRQTGLAHRWSKGSITFTGCSKYIQNLGQKNGAKWEAVHNFVDLEKFTFQASTPPDAPLVFLSRLDEVKGPDTAIEIARRSNRRLILAGNRAESGADAQFFAEKVEPHIDGKQITWIGPVNDDQKNDLLGQAAAMLVPIRWHEPFGIVFAEALACGTPVISSPMGALPEIIESGKNGFLVETVAEGVAAVENVETIGRANCRQTAESKFERRVISDQYLRLYERLISEEAD